MKPLLLLVFATTAWAKLPEGHWQTDDMPQLCLDIYQQRVELTLQTSGEDRVNIDGATEAKEARGRFHVALTVEKLHLKHISLCRKHVWDKDLEELDFLGAKVAPKEVLKLTLRFFCDHEHSAVEVCRSATCRVLHDKSKDCR